MFEMRRREGRKVTIVLDEVIFLPINDDGGEDFRDSFGSGTSFADLEPSVRPHNICDFDIGI